MNPFTEKPHSAQYKKILDGRKKLPVYSQMDEFLKTVCGLFVDKTLTLTLPHSSKQTRSPCKEPDLASAALTDAPGSMVGETGSGKTTQ